MDTDSELDMNEVMLEVVKHIELRGKMYEAINIDAVRAVCYVVGHKTDDPKSDWVDDPKSDWITPLGILMGSIMYILDLHSGMNDEERQTAATAISSSILSNTMIMLQDKKDRVVN
jgi:hypothetical protein